MKFGRLNRENEKEKCEQTCASTRFLMTLQRCMMVNVGCWFPYAIQISTRPSYGQQGKQTIATTKGGSVA